MKGTVDVELLVPATTAALEGYRGAVVVEVGQGVYLHALCWDGRVVWVDGAVWSPGPLAVYLDLAGGIGRWRAQCMLADHEGAQSGEGRRPPPPSSCGVLWYRDPDDAGAVWTLQAQIPGRDLPMWHTYGVTIAADTDVPALADLDPDDDTRLVDGARRVDALALAHAYRGAFVGEVTRG